MKRYGPYPSKSGPGEYWVSIADDGMIACDCRGFLIKKADKPRYCTHTDEVMKKLELVSQIRGDYQFIVHHGSVQMDLLPPKASPSDVYTSAKERGYFNPMLAIAPEKGKTVDDYDADNYVMELKYDGERKIVSGHQGKVYTWNRPRSGKGEIGKEEPLPNQIQIAFEALAQQIDFTIDGELYLPGTTQSTDVNRLENRPRLIFAAFDILRFGAHNKSVTVLDNDYLTRRGVLEGFIKCMQFSGDPTVLLSEQWKPNQAAVQAIWDRGGEGVILKRKDSKYREGYRSKDWIKVKILKSIAMQIIGYKKGKNGPYSSVCLKHDDGSETDVKTLNNLWLKKLAQDPDRYLGKYLVIEYRGRSTDGGYRHPMWQYLEEEVQ